MLTKNPALMPGFFMGKHLTGKFLDSHCRADCNVNGPTLLQTEFGTFASD
jgi:hypothetical protein